MIKTAQDAYLAGRQAAMEKLAESDGSNTALNVAALAAIPAGAHMGAKYNPNFQGTYYKAENALAAEDWGLERLRRKVKSQGERLIRAKENAKNLSRNRYIKGAVDLERKILQNYESSLSSAEKSRTRLISDLMAAEKNYKGKGYMDILRRNKGTAIGLGLGAALAGGIYLAGRSDEDEQEPVAKVGPSAFYTSPTEAIGYSTVKSLSNQEKNK